MARSFVYLAAVVDVFSPAEPRASGVDHEGSRLLHRSAGGGPGQAHGKPDIFNSDQGSQFTSVDFTARAAEAAASRISMDGRGAWRDNVFAERLWRKRQNTRRSTWRAYDSVSEACSSIGRYLASLQSSATSIRSLDRAHAGRGSLPRHRLSRRRHELPAARGTCLRSGYALPPSRPAREIRVATNPGSSPLSLRGESCSEGSRLALLAIATSPSARTPTREVPPFALISATSNSTLHVRGWLARSSLRRCCMSYITSWPSSR